MCYALTKDTHSAFTAHPALRSWRPGVRTVAKVLAVAGRTAYIYIQTHICGCNRTKVGNVLRRHVLYMQMYILRENLCLYKQM